MQELDLEKIRQEIDKVDQQLADVLESRLHLVMQVAAYKKSKGLPVKDKNREAKVIEKVAGFLENKAYSVAVKNIMRGIIDQACLLEETALSEANDKTYEVACFGPAGSFTHQALEEYFHGRRYNRHHFQTFEEVISSISDGTMDYAVLPIENSSTGGITSHPQGLKQCADFFRDYPEMEKVPYFSTSKSAEEVAEKQDITLGAIAGKQAAELYNLKIIAPAINSNSNNYTRFVIIAKKPEIVANANKITLIVAVKHETGSLYKMLASFYHMGLNMLNLESRPIVGKTWEYFFYIDVTGNLADPLVIDVMEEIKSKSTYCKVLGNYRAYERKE